MHYSSPKAVRSRYTIAIAALFTVFLATGTVDAVRFSADELKTLNEGGTIRRLLSNSGQGGFFGGSGWAVINAPTDEIWSALQDWGSYTAIFPHTVEAKEVSRKQGLSLLRMKLGHPVIQVLYHVEMRPDKKKNTINFRLVKNHPTDLDNIDGYWQLFPLDPKRTLVAYVLSVHVPMGIVNLLSASFKKMALRGILGVPGHLKEWMEIEAPGKYRKKTPKPVVTKPVASTP